MSPLLRGCGCVSQGSLHALDAAAEASDVGAPDRLISVCPSQIWMQMGLSRREQNQHETSGWDPESFQGQEALLAPILGC